MEIANNNTSEMDGCGTCKFFKRNPKNLQQGFCQHKPPQLFSFQNPSGGIQFMSQFPPVDTEMVCGEFRPRDSI